MDMIIPPLRIKIMLESNPLKSTILVGGLAVSHDHNMQRYSFPMECVHPPTSSIILVFSLCQP